MRLRARHGDNPEKEKSNAGFYWGVALSAGVLGLQIAANGSSSLHTDAMVASAIQGGDGSAYAVVARAAKHERGEELERARRYRRWAASLICSAALLVGGKATYDMIQGDFDRPEPQAALVIAGAGVANILIMKKLLPDAEPGTSHMDALRHSAVDAGASIVMAVSVYAASRGVVGADQAATVLTSIGVIAGNLPTDPRMGIARPAQPQLTN